MKEGRHGHKAGTESVHRPVVDAARCGKHGGRVCGSVCRRVLAGRTVTPPGGAGPSAGRIHSILDSLIRERQRLRNAAHEESLLEANRLAIVYWQQELTRALAARSGDQAA